MVKIWRPNLDYGWAEAGITDSEQGIIFGNVSMNTRTGNRLVGVFSNLKMEVSVDTDDIWLDSFMCGSALVVSGKLKMLLEEFGTNVQYIAFEIFSTNTQLSGKTFFYSNILDVVECLDLERGDYSFWKKEGFTDHVDGINRLVINEKKAEGNHFFRIAKGAEYIICVSEELARTILTARMQGMKFVEPNNWNAL